MSGQQTYPRGSEWRRWDLHVHTPFSALNNQFGNDFDEYSKQLFLRAISAGVAVVGVTDYFIVDGFEKLRGIQRDHAKLVGLLGEENAKAAEQILLLPNIEFRVDPIIWVEGRTASKVNLHVIFAEDVSLADIRNNFLSLLNFTYQAGPQSADEKRSLTKEHLTHFGEVLRQQHEKFRSADPLKVGMTQVLILHSDISQVLSDKPSLFAGKYLLVLEPNEDLSKLDWNDAGHSARKQLLQKADALFCANVATTKLFLGLSEKMTPKQVRDQVRSLKPSFTVSDAHDTASLFARPKLDFTWIKADPTFRGLRQAILEPRDRVYLGQMPPQLERYRTNPTKYFYGLSFAKVDQPKSAEVWFRESVAINLGLVAVIGNKGSGKSALADVIGLLGNSTILESDYSFLNRTKFKDAKDGKASDFNATIYWHSGGKHTKSLNQIVSPGTPESIKYLPQAYVEKICNAISFGEAREFDAELKSVVFSHFEVEERLGAATLDEYMEKHSGIQEQSISKLRTELEQLNASILAREMLLSDESKRGRVLDLETKKRELESHDAAKPQAVGKPEQSEQQLGHISQQIEAARSELRELRGYRDTQLATREDRAGKVNAAKRVRQLVNQLAGDIESWKKRLEPDLRIIGLDLNAILVLTLSSAAVDQKEVAWVEELERARHELDNADSEGLAARLSRAEAKLSLLVTELDLPSRLYNQYLQELGSWERKRQELVGTSDQPRSLTWYQAQVDRLGQLPEELKTLRAQRIALLEKIHGGILEIVENYREVYRPVRERARDLRKIHGAEIEVEARLDASAFTDRFLNLINQQRKGEFSGSAEGKARCLQLVNEADFSSAEGLTKFSAAVEAALRGDDQLTHTRIQDQLSKGSSIGQLYNFLYGADYLKPLFVLRWNGRELSQLSPGERGTLLLLFYLLVDKSDIPLVIDQPEENLDNQTVFQVLVKAIREARNRRQIIIVTHNPNIAVVCDADQIVHAALQKSNGNTLVYTTGSIENPTINKMLMDILEGTEPAFNDRDSKYYADRTT